MNIALHGNWVDLVILIILIFFIHQGFVNGFWSILIDFVSFFGALLISVKTYNLGSQFLKNNFSLSEPLANAMGYLIMAVLSEVIISFILGYLIAKLPPKILKNHATKVLGVILSFGQGIILIAFAVTFAISLPVSPWIKTDISNSKIGGLILGKTSGLGKNINIPFTYLTVEPASHESLPLDNKTNDLIVDRESETEMFALVNKERISRGGSALSWDVKLAVVAENYGRLMWQDHYFGHYDPDGHDVGNRLQDTNISYSIAGENLALAPTLQIAHTGLMNSPGHRANILEVRFKKVGIGVIDNGYYGKMFVQVFTD